MVGTRLQLVASQPDRAAIVDEYGQLDTEIESVLAPIGRKMKRRDELHAQIKGWHDESPADQTFSESGKAYRVEISQRAEETFLNKAKLYTKLRRDKFIALCTFTLKAAKTVLTGEEFEALTRKERTGHRKVTVVALKVAAA